MSQEHLKLPTSISIGMPCGPYIPWQTSMALTRTVRDCALMGVTADMTVIAGSSAVQQARSQTVHQFLTQTDASHLFWIDSDIVWESKDFVKTLALASVFDVVCATYPMKNEARSIVVKHPDLKNFEINKYGLVKIWGVGLGFTVVSRAALEKLVATKPLVYDAAKDNARPDVFRFDTVPGKHEHPNARGEDLAFFADLRELGYDIWLDPRIVLGHVGTHVYRNDPVAALGLTDYYANQD
jgi:hypothetical protein